jgi:hypothetical protein
VSRDDEHQLLRRAERDQFAYYRTSPLQRNTQNGAFTTVLRARPVLASEPRVAQRALRTGSERLVKRAEVP